MFEVNLPKLIKRMLQEVKIPLLKKSDTLLQEINQLLTSKGYELDNFIQLCLKPLLKI